MATAQQVRYAELTCTPYTSVRPHRTGRDADRGLHRRRSRTPASRPSATSGWCCAGSTTSRARPGCPAAETTLEYALEHRTDGAGRLRSRRPRDRACRARSSSRTSTRPGPPGCAACPHAGETTGPQTVWDALHLLGAERIGHGTSAAQDPELLAHLASTGIALEVCPSSNIATRAVASLAEHPIRIFRDAGVTVTVHSDDPPMFGDHAQPRVRIAADLLDLDHDGGARPGPRPRCTPRSPRTTSAPGCSTRSTLTRSDAGRPRRSGRRRPGHPPPRSPPGAPRGW